MPDLGRLVATASLKTTGFENPLASARAGLSKLRETMSTLGAPLAALGAGFAAFKSAEGFAEGMRGMFDLGHELGAQARVTGESIKSLVVLRQAYKEAGLDAGSVTTSLVMMQRALGGVNEVGQPTKKIFEQLGLSMTQLKGMGAIEQFKAISKAISNLGDQASKTAAITAIFGRGGAEMEALLGNPDAIKEAAKAVGNMGDVMQRNADLFGKVSNGFENLQLVSQKFFAGMDEKVGPMLDEVLTKINSIDLSKLGEQVGTAVATLYNVFKGGAFGKLVSLSLQGGVASGLSLLSDQNFWSGVWNLVKGTFDGLDVIVLEAFKPAMTALMATAQQAVATLSGGKIDPQRDAARAQNTSAMEEMISINKQRTRLDLTEESGPALDEKLKKLQKLYAQASADFDSSAGMVNNPTVADRYNFMAGQGGIMDDIEAQKRQGAGKNNATGLAQLKEAMRAMKDVAPEIKAQINAIIGKYKPVTGAASPGVTPAQGTGKFDALKNLMDSQRGRKDEESDRLAKIGLYIGGSSP
ncbi:MAG: hypothetical protein ABSE62_15955, partial [Chthoniobacteraceae bacterium]